MSTIYINNLTFGYEGSADNVFENVNLQLDTDWKLGLVGRNGKGKTTLLKLLCGQLSYSGSIAASVRFEYFPYEVSNKNDTVYAVIEQIDSRYEEWKIRKELNLLDFDEIDFFKPFNTYSGGEQTKILLAVLFSKDNAFLLIDEPTNHLDTAGRQSLSSYLSHKSSYIIVSHDKHFLDGCIDHVLGINRADIELRRGNISSYLENMRQRDAAETAQNERLKSDIKRLRESARQASDWADKAEQGKYGGKNEKSGLRPDKGYIGAKAAKLMQRSTGLKERIEQAAAEKSSLLKNVERADAVKMQSVTFFKDRLLTVKDLSVTYGDQAVNAPLSFELNAGERVLLFGKNGGGKTSVLKAIIGKVPYSGTVAYSRGLIISYVSQDTSFLSGTLQAFCASEQLDKTALFTMLRKLGYEKNQFDTRIEEFSEGQKKKLLIAKSLCERANLYVWDEPLNYIDIISREQIKETLLGSDASMLFVEHDRDFGETIATRKIQI